MTILYRYAKYKELDLSETVDLSDYSDMGNISNWALDAMKWAVEAGIIQGRTPTTIVPQGTSTRAEIAMIFKRYIEDFLGKVD
ncbi:MAG: S-layer homology domain-containing protein [Clostridiales bacterium]|nr:S-layer homology domain-containing protein [Clostridiales bacterium]